MFPFEADQLSDIISTTVPVSLLPSVFSPFPSLDLFLSSLSYQDLEHDHTRNGAEDPLQHPEKAGADGVVNAGDHPVSAQRVREEGLSAWVEYQSRLAVNGSDEKGRGDAKKDNNGGGTGRSDRREADRGAYREYGGIGVLTLDVWGNQPWRLNEAGMATAKGEEGPGFHPKPLLSRRWES